MPVKAKADQDQSPDDTEGDANEHSQPPGGMLCTGRSRQSPLAEKIPDANAQVKRRTQYPNYKKREVKRIEHVCANRVICRAAAGQQALGIEMPTDENKSDKARVPLERIHP